MALPTEARRSRAGLPSEARLIPASEGWSGRRGSNPRPTAWKAVTLPLSYSRLLPHSGGFASGPPTRSLPACSLPQGRLTWLAIRSRERSERSAKDGGEGRIRTFEAAGATDLQSVAFDRFATSPKLFCRLPSPRPAARTFQAASPFATKAASTFPTAISLEREKFRATCDPG